MVNTTNTQDDHGPQQLPKSILEAFQKEGYSPHVVIAVEAGKEQVFSTEVPPFSGPGEFDPKKLSLPFIQLSKYNEQETDSLKSNTCWTYFCSYYGCWWIPYPC